MADREYNWGSSSPIHLKKGRVSVHKDISSVPSSVLVLQQIVYVIVLPVSGIVSCYQGQRHFPKLFSENKSSRYFKNR